MRYRDRNGIETGADSGQDRFLRKLYKTTAGRLLVYLLIRPAVSRLGGRLLDQRGSRVLIRPFIRSAGIHMEEYTRQKVSDYDSYNDFFCRRIRPELRPVEHDEDAFISPCDGKLSVYPIRRDAGFRIKNTYYTVESLLKSPRLAQRYAGGFLCLFRLTVEDYHRYVYAESGMKSEQRKIPGVYHTVNPAAGDVCPIYQENTREYCLIRTRRAGVLVQMEVGALLVGKISNCHPGRTSALRGQEKGKFEFGGSTIVVIIQPGKVRIDQELLDNTADHWETKVRLGERIGTISASAPD